MPKAKQYQSQAILTMNNNYIIIQSKYYQAPNSLIKINFLISNPKF